MSNVKTEVVVGEVGTDVGLKSEKKKNKNKKKGSKYTYTLYMFSENAKIRRFCIYLISRNTFNKAIFFVIFLNCITLAMERPSISTNSYVSEIDTQPGSVFYRS